MFSPRYPNALGLSQGTLGWLRAVQVMLIVMVIVMLGVAWFLLRHAGFRCSICSCARAGCAAAWCGDHRRADEGAKPRSGARVAAALSQRAAPAWSAGWAKSKNLSLMGQFEAAGVAELPENGRGGSSAMQQKCDPVACTVTLASSVRPPPGGRTAGLPGRNIRNAHWALGRQNWLSGPAC